MANAAGGTSHRLKPGAATIRSRLRSPGIRLSWVSFRPLASEVAAPTYRSPESGARSLMRAAGWLLVLGVCPLLPVELMGQADAESPDWLVADSVGRTVTLKMTVSAPEGA